MGTHDGGKPHVKQRPYSEPKGPTDLGHKGPGLGGSNHGHQQQHHQPIGEFSGRPGLKGGTNHGNKGSQEC